jgi:leucyl-tRNA synthetase
MPKRYDPKSIEAKWQKVWEKNQKLYHASDTSKKKKKYILVEFPYPSGAGLHVGHMRAQTAADVTSRYYRAKGFEVMFPIGWDAFGLPAENYAIKMGVNPRISTAKNITTFKKQIKSLGFSFDWQREVNTTDPNYYKWTQWLFLQFYKAGLAYEATAPINWCPVDKTGLANEEVVNGRCERCGAQVEQKNIRQWFLKITDYAQKLLDGLKDLPEWPDAVKTMQANWIGHSDGTEIKFEILSRERGYKKEVTVFTTRPDTLFGATYLVLAPENKIIAEAMDFIQNKQKVNAYIKDASNKTDINRTDLQKDKTGEVLKGLYAINPATKEEIPVWIADYVLASYGTGAIMAVPAHDERDQAFAEKFNLPIIKVVGDDGLLQHSGDFNGLTVEEAKSKITAKFGKSVVQYKLRDWVFARQRYWGEPIPIIHCEKCGLVPVPEKDLPVVLPNVKKYEPTGTGESPLAEVHKWVNVKCPKCKGPAKRETSTMPNWAGSSWYFLRYADPKNKKEFASKKMLKKWTPVDLYFGGMEHTTLHLLYSRFWNLFLYDRKLVTAKEPFKRRQPHGIILAHDGEKMSKSKGNVVNPDDLVKRFGADTTRLYQLFLGPHDQAVSWNENGIIGVRRFLEKTYKFVYELTINPSRFAKNNSEKADRAINFLISKVASDIETIKFNTVVSACMEFMNMVYSEQVTPELLADFAIVLSPVAPHLAEEIWQMVLPYLAKKPKVKGGVTVQPWPKFDAKKIISNTVNFVLQVNGKFRGNLEVPAGSTQKDVEEGALKIATVQNAIAGNKIKKVVFVQDKIINFVI